MILWSQVLNGVLLPFVLIYMILLINKKGLMKDWTNSRVYNAIAWLSVIIMIGLTLALAAITVRQISPSASASPAKSSWPLADMQRDNARRHSLKPDVAESGAAHLLR